MDRQMDGWVHRQMERQIIDIMDGWIDLMDEWIDMMDGWIDRYDGWTDKQIDECI